MYWSTVFTNTLQQPVPVDADPLRQLIKAALNCVIIDHCCRCSLALTAGDASVCGRLDGGWEGGIPDSLPFPQVWSQPCGRCSLQRASGAEQQIWCLLLQAQRYYGSTAERVCRSVGDLIALFQLYKASNYWKLLPLWAHTLNQRTVKGECSLTRITGLSWSNSSSFGA